MDTVHLLGVIIDNLVQIKTRREEIWHGNNKPIMISLFNAQSICNKEEMILDHLLHYRVDLGVIMETWMNEDNESDKIWLQSMGYQQKPVLLLFMCKKGKKRWRFGVGVKKITASQTCR